MSIALSISDEYSFRAGRHEDGGIKRDPESGLFAKPVDAERCPFLDVI
jgi:hypothetical protein